MLKKVISGAQIGADIAGLRAAHSCGLLTGGMMPKGFKTKHGVLPGEDVKLFGLRETQDSGYPLRTRMNVRDSDATIQFAYNWDSPGEKLTTRLAREYGKPVFPVVLHCPEFENYMVMSRPTMLLITVEWVKAYNIETLNIAGNGNTAIEFCVESFLVEVFTQLRS